VVAAIVFVALVVPSLVLLFRLALNDTLAHGLPPADEEVAGV